MTNKKWLLFCCSVMSIFSVGVAVAADNSTKTGIPLDSEWKHKIYMYAQNNVKHSAWGIAHSERNYQLTIALAEQEGIKIDSDVIFAAAFLHDIGAIEPLRNKDIEHSIRSVELVEPLLEASHFPMEKWLKVKATILGHMYYAERYPIAEANLFHDADALDFLGAIGIARLVSVTERHKWAPDLAGAFATLQRFKTDLPNLFYTNSAKKIAEDRISKMEPFFSLLDQETFRGKAL